MVFLQGVGVSTSLAVRIYKQYGDESIAVVRSEPYRLAADVWGIGFKTADTIAQAVGIPHDSPQRVKAGLQYTLSEASRQRALLPARAEPGRRRHEDPGRGHRAGPARAWTSWPLRRASSASRVPANVAGPTAGTVPAVYLVPFHRAEISLAAGLLRLLGAGATGCPGSRRWTGTRRWPGCGPDRRRAGPRAGAGGAAGADREGRGADRRAGLRQELHRALHRRAGPRRSAPRSCWPRRPAGPRNGSPS